MGISEEMAAKLAGTKPPQPAKGGGVESFFEEFADAAGIPKERRARARRALRMWLDEDED